MSAWLHPAVRASSEHVSTLRTARQPLCQQACPGGDGGGVGGEGRVKEAGEGARMGAKGTRGGERVKGKKEGEGLRAACERGS